MVLSPTTNRSRTFTYAALRACVCVCVERSVAHVRPMHGARILVFHFTCLMPVVIKFNCILTNSKMVFEFSHLAVYSTQRTMWIDARAHTHSMFSYCSVALSVRVWVCVSSACWLLALEREQADQPCRQCHKICFVQIFYLNWHTVAEASTLNASALFCSRRTVAWMRIPSRTGCSLLWAVSAHRSGRLG